MPSMDGRDESSIVEALIVGGFLQLLVTVALDQWGRWVSRRRGGAFRYAVWMPALAFLLQVIGVAIATTLLVRAFDAVASTDPMHKAAQLAESISSAMSFSAPFLLVSSVLFVASVITFAIGSFLPRRDAA